MNNNLIELSYNEMLNIEGGDWLVTFGAWCHKQYCAIVEALNEPWTEERVRMAETLANCM